MRRIRVNLGATAVPTSEHLIHRVGLVLTLQLTAWWVVLIPLQVSGPTSYHVHCRQLSWPFPALISLGLLDPFPLTCPLSLTWIPDLSPVSPSWSHAPAQFSASLFLKSPILAWATWPCLGQPSSRACILFQLTLVYPQPTRGLPPDLTHCSFSSSSHLVSAPFLCHFLADFAFVLPPSWAGASGGPASLTSHSHLRPVTGR